MQVRHGNEFAFSPTSARGAGVRLPLWGEAAPSFFGKLLRLYSFVPVQAGYGDKWASQ